MALAHVSQYGKVYDSLAGDHTLAEYLTNLYLGAKSVEVRVESGTVSYSVGVAMVAASGGKALLPGDSATESTARFEVADLGAIHIFEPGSAGDSKLYIEARTF